MEAIKSILDHTGATWRDVVKVTKYLTDFREADAMHKTMAKYFGDWRPAVDHGVHQPAVVARRAHRARHDRGAAEADFRLILRRARSARLEGWGGPMLRDALLRSAPQHEAER